MEILKEISEFLQKGRVANVKELTSKALNDGINPSTILNDGLFDGMSIIGEKFKRNEVFVPEVLIAARAMNAGIEILRPYLAKAEISNTGTVIIGTVKGDLHDIGKNIVKIMLEGKGFKVIDLGVDVDSEKFVSAAIENNANLICCSALLTTTMLEMKKVVEKIEAAGMHDKIKVMVGGAPVTQSFCDSIGADFYTSDAASCAEVAAKSCTN